MRVTVFAVCAGGLARPAVAARVVPVLDEVAVTTEAHIDSVTVGQRFVATYHFAFADSLSAIARDKLDAGTCRLMDLRWEEKQDGGRIERTAIATFIPLSVDSSVVAANAFDFVSPRGDTLRAWSDEIRVPIRRIAAAAEDVRPLKEQWKAPPNWWLWGGIALAALAAALALAWWIRRRRRRPAAIAPELRLPPEVVALAELDRVAALGLIARGEFKTHYTLVVDALRHYLAARYGVEAMDRTSFELLGDLERRGVRVEGLPPLLDEADLVKFAKFVPAAEAGNAAVARARDIVVATTPRPAPAVPDAAAGANETGEAA
jgi:hypothetical protein